MTSVCQWILRYDSKITSNKRKKYTGQPSSKLKKKKKHFVLQRALQREQKKKSTEWEKNICKLYQN